MIIAEAKNGTGLAEIEGMIHYEATVRFRVPDTIFDEESETGWGSEWTTRTFDESVEITALVAFEYDVSKPAAIRPMQVQFNQNFSIDVDKHLYQ